MWDNPRILNLAAGTLCGLAVMVFTVAGIVTVMRSPLFPVSAIGLTHPLGKTTRHEIQAVAQAHVAGNFFAVSPIEVRSALEALPWVRRASVRRVWPDRLEVTLEEHVAFARWGEQALVNTHGELFYGSTDAALPVFLAPSGSEQEMMNRYTRFARILAPLGERLERLVVTPRHAWELRLDSGLHIMLGRDADRAEARLARFVDAYPSARGRAGRGPGYADLRYPNGFALRLTDPKG
jgi:cell division protein FtsQ